MGGGGKGKGGGSNQISEAQLARGARTLSDVATPTREALAAKLQKAVYLGDIKPIEAITILQQESKAAGITIDPRLEMQQYEALGELNRQATQMGLTSRDINALFDVGAEEHAYQKQARLGIGRDAAGRGVGGSGIEQQAQAEALQAPYEPGQASRLDVVRQAAAKREGAKGAAGELGGQLREQSFGERANVAGAKDLINRFNVDATNLTRLGNVEDARKVALRNAVERQRVSVENTNIANQQEASRAGAAQQEFENRLSKAQSISDLYTQGGIGQANRAGREPAKPSAGFAAAGSAGQLLSEYGPAAWDKFMGRGGQPTRPAPAYGKNVIGGSALL